MRSIVDDALKGKKVLVTGATGFVGGHLARRLAEDEGAIVTGTGRNLDAVPFLADAGVNLVRADLKDKAGMAAVVADQEIVFHVAAWLSTRHGTEAEARAINVDASTQLLKLADEALAKKFVLVSSIAAYGPPTSLVMDEASHQADPHQLEIYGKTKAAGEIEALTIGRNLNIDVSVGRPGMVYGPRSYSWSVGMLQMIKKGVPTLFGKADGHAFPVYIDNLCDGLILCAVNEAAVGEAFNFVDPPISFDQFFHYYSRMAQRKPRRIPMPLAQFVVQLNKVFGLNVPLTKERLKFYTTKTVYPTQKAGDLLGYHPRVSINDGMRRTELWFRENGYLDRQS